MKFIDLYAGLGGFHLALKRLGHECVFACEIDTCLRALYARNFGITPAGDIREVDLDDIPQHDVLCAGFPCQPFSKAGKQNGFDCPRWGNLLDFALQIATRHRPQYLILENVPNLRRHRSGQTWQAVLDALKGAGYEALWHELSPHEFGIPQVRKRLFVVGSRSGLGCFRWPEPARSVEPCLKEHLDTQPGDARPLSSQIERCLQVWQDFLDRFPADEQLPSFPIWSMEFGATYPFRESTPFGEGLRRLGRYRGSHGLELARAEPQQRMGLLPAYARRPDTQFPAWKVRFIEQNRDLYERHHPWIDAWLPQVLEFAESHQKFEWNCKGEPRDVWRHVIQFRASGVRVKRPTTSPSLVAMTSTQVPIIAWERRYMTPTECARIQGMDGLALPESQDRAFAALGNAVNVDVVRQIAAVLIRATSDTARARRASPERR